MGNKRSKTRLMLFVFPLFFFFCPGTNSVVVDYISPGQSLKGNQTIVSKSGIFELGFFKPENSEGYYIGIWYRNISIQTVVWVANRGGSIEDPSKSELKINEHGRLVLLNNDKLEIWSSDHYNSTLAVLLDTGNFVLTKGSNSSVIIWQSFDEPTDTWLPGAKLWLDEHYKETQGFTSWRSLSDPAWGRFSFHISQNSDMEDPDKQVYTIEIRWATYNKNNEMVGDCDCQILLQSVSGIEMHEKGHQKYFTLSSSLSGLVIDYLGSINQLTWLEHEGKWFSSPAIEPSDQCNVYNPCGVTTHYNRQRPPHCTCLPGFKPRSPKDWRRNDWSGGCERTTYLDRTAPIPCTFSLWVDNNTLPLGKFKFLEIPLKKLPQNAEPLGNKSAEYWRLACSVECSCSAYAYYRGKYYRWSTDKWNLQQPSDGEPINGYLYLLLRLPENGKERNAKAIAGIVGVPVLLVIVFIFIWIYRRRYMIAASRPGEGSLVVYKYKHLRKATKNFSEKLGGGSFGSVFKGTLPNSTTIAVKRLEGFRQGDKQFRSDVSTIGRIQHVNILRLRGFYSKATKKLLVYDYMKYGSLDNHLFHQNGGEVLDWSTRFQIAIGTARGLAYLHEECRERIIHCDIKPENILLDANFQPKVADFGMAKLLGRDFSRVLTTMRGTIGYLAPEWISGSTITPKADVYSYGMMLLEIISGRRNTSKFEGGNVSYFPVWAAAQLIEGEVLSLLDHRLEGIADLEELTRACRVACWCVQDDEAQRPSMVTVVHILAGVVEMNIPPVPTRLLNLVDQEDPVLFLDSISDQSTQLHTEYGS